MKLYVGFGTVHLQKETFYFLHKNAFKTYKNDLKTTQNLRSSRLEVFWKNVALKSFGKLAGQGLCRCLFFDKETPLHVFSPEFCEILKNFYFVTYQGLLLNHKTWNARS